MPPKTRPGGTKKNTDRGSPSAPGTPTMVDRVTPAYSIETFQSVRTESLAEHILQPGETRLTFVRSINAECVDMGEYAYHWLAEYGKHKVAFILRNTATGARSAFAMCTIRHASSTIFVDFVCATEKRVGAGRLMMRGIRLFARRHNLAWIQLTSLLHEPTLSFYKRLGFMRGPAEASAASIAKARRTHKDISELLGMLGRPVTTKQVDALVDRIRRRTGLRIKYRHDRSGLIDLSLLNDGYFDEGFRDLNGLVFARNKNEMTARLPKFHMSTERPM